ncbi:MAG: NADH-quinone oxidoreductase subunit N, partial [Ignavibacteria bacterium]|nr:NADH-quinone oxidoreductase subunit N [Ignavibacteria bacterium]
MIVAAIIALLNTVVAYYYYVRVLKNLYLVKVETEKEVIKFSPANIVVVLLLLIPVFVFGIYFTPLVNLAKDSISMIGF